MDHAPMQELPLKLLAKAREIVPSAPPPSTGIVLGTGLGDWVDSLDAPTWIEYADLPGFPQSTVEGHRGRLVLGWIGTHPVLVLQGRLHLYDGYSAGEVCIGVRLLARLGLENIIFTNASGAINPLFQAGSIMLIQDQINHTGQQPLIGPNIEHFGPRFPDMSRPFDPELSRIVLHTGTDLGLRLEQGVYIGVCGPSLETPAETRAYKRWGADAVGMSTVLEVIAARHMGLKTLGLSCLTNKNLPDCMAKTSHQAIIAQAEQTGHDLGRLLTALIPRIDAHRKALPDADTDPGGDTNHRRDLP